MTLINKLRAGTEVLRTGGGATLTASECGALLDVVNAAERYRVELREFQATAGLDLEPAGNTWRGELLAGLARLDALRDTA